MNICVRSSTGRWEIGDVGGDEGGDLDAFECVNVDGETMGVGGEWDDTGCCPIMIGEENGPIIVRRDEHK
jgi:hypothetical protein